MIPRNARRPADRWRPFMVVALLLSLLGSALPTLAAQPAAAAPPRAAADVQFTVNTTDDLGGVTGSASPCVLQTPLQCSLRAAIEQANFLAIATPTTTIEIVLTAGATYTLTITGQDEDNAKTGDLDIRSNVTITGNGATVRGLQPASTPGGSSTDTDRVFDIYGDWIVNLNNLTIEDGYANNNDSNGGDGGGIRHRLDAMRPAQPLTLTGVTVEDNDTGGVIDGCGAGIYNGFDQILIIKNSTIKGNGLQSTDNPGDGGGICNNGTLTMDGTVVSGNLGNRGGGLYNVGSAEITGSTFSSNSAQASYFLAFFFANYGAGGGIYNKEGSLKLTGSRLVGNSAVGGGGLYNQGYPNESAGRAGAQEIATATIDGTDIINNVATFYGGGILNQAFSNTNTNIRASDLTDSVVTMTGGSLRNNLAAGALLSFFFPDNAQLSALAPPPSENVGGVGGGAYNGGTFTMTGVAVEGNSAAAYGTGQFANGTGGGIYNLGTMGVTDGTLANNFVSGAGQGGAVSNGLPSGLIILLANTTPQPARIAAIDTAFTATNVTISGNSAPTGGGAIVNDDESAVTLNFATIANNSSGLLNILAPSPTARAQAATLGVQNSIVALNAAYNCSGTIADGGYNIDSANTCAFTATGSQANVADPKLGPLTINAPGTTATHALLAGSPALDKVPAASLGGVTKDQRGVDRPQGAVSDIGAYELIVIPASPSPSPSATPSYTTVLTVTGPGTVNPGAGSYTSPAGSTQTYTASPNSGAVLLGWTIDGQFAGFGNPLVLPVTKNRTVVAAFAPIPQFCDITTSTPNYTAIINLAARGIIRGSDNQGGEGNGAAKCFRPDDILFRIHVAGMVARAFGWDLEDHGNTFTDKGSVDNDLWRNAGTLAFYNVALGYRDGTYDPTGPVLHAQSVSFVTRAMIRKEYWVLQEDNATYYTAVPQTSGHRQDAVTFFTYASNIPGTTAPTDPWGGPTGYDAPSTRSYFAQVLWQGYASYFSTNRIP